jgi:hypothetical protein
MKTLRGQTSSSIRVGQITLSGGGEGGSNEVGTKSCAS